MKRSSIRIEPDTFKTSVKIKPMRGRSKKRDGHDKRMRDACAGEPCYLRIPGVCCGRWDTCVPAHRNEGKGTGLKNPDFYTLPACLTCHQEFDQGKRFMRQEKRDMWNAAFSRWEIVRARKLGITEKDN